MDKELARIIAELLRHSLDSINWEFSRLTNNEQLIVRDQATLNAIKEWADSTL